MCYTHDKDVNIRILQQESTKCGSEGRGLLIKNRPMNPIIWTTRVSRGWSVKKREMVELMLLEAANNSKAD